MKVTGNRFEEVRLTDLESVAQAIASKLSRDPKVILLLEGPMGAGKTEFTKRLVPALGGTDEAVSPSFAIHNEYPAADFSVHHFDLFRLESEDDLESTGFWDNFQASKAIVIIEWASRLSDFGLEDSLPRSWRKYELTIEPTSSETRTFILKDD